MEGENKKIFLFISITLAMVLVGFCFFVNFVSAMSIDDEETYKKLLVTEIMYNPPGTDNKDDNHEWIEVYNSAKKTIFIDKADFRLSDSSDVCHKINSSLNLEPEKFAVFADDQDIFLKTHENFLEKESAIDSSFNLKDSDTIKISFDKCATWQIEIPYRSEWGAKNNGKTLEKIDFEKGYTELNWQESCQGGSPGEKSSKKPCPEDKIQDDFPDNLVISEIFPNPSSKEEFIELYNPNKSIVDLTDWSLLDKNLEEGKKEGKKIGMTIEAESYLEIPKKIFGFSLNNTGGEIVILKNPNGKEVNRVSYLENAKKDYSYALKDGVFYWTSTPTPGEKNIITGENKSDENLSAAEKVYLNEIFPNPKSEEKTGEFIELVSKEENPVDLYKWAIRDASKTGKYIFKDHVVINSNAYFVIYRPQFKIALNNNAESVYLYNPSGKLTSSVTYSKAPANASYNYDEIGWRWSKFLTPGAKNKFDSLPKIKIKKPKTAYKNTYAQFAVKAKDKETKNLKYVWDFGDGHKSYLKETSHKYLKIGKYRVKLSVRDESQTVEKYFRVRVRKYPRPKIEIMELTPNPSGRDTEFETLVLKNDSKKKVDLKDYKIATGSKKLANHPIYSNIILKSGEEKIITRVDSRIVLNNKAGKVALLYPDGKTADEVEYSKEKIKDDETFAKVDGKWQWIASPEEKISSKGDSAKAPNGENNLSNEGEILGATDENQNNYAHMPTGYTSEDEFIFFKLFGLLEYKPQEMNFCPVNQSPITIAFLLVPNQ